MDVTVTEVASGVHHARAKHVSWVLVTDGDAVTVVDTGYPGDRDRLLRSLQRIGRTVGDVAEVLLTHGHPDHIGSADYLRTTHGIPVRAHRDEVANACGDDIEQVSEASLLRRGLGAAVAGVVGLGPFAGFIVLVVFEKTRWVAQGMPAGTAISFILAAGACVVLIIGLSQSYK